MIEFQSVGKTFRGGTTALADLTLTVPSGKTTVIVGPPGAGKTTALQLVLRMLEPTRGQISWDGSPLKSKRKSALRRQVGYVEAGGALFPHRTVAENIGTVPRLLGQSKAKAELRALELLGTVGLDRFLAHRYPAQLSGGQRQRVALARALAADPAVLVLDDPFAGVDAAVRRELQQLLLDLQGRTNQTILLATDDIEEAIRLGDQVAVLRVGGRTVQVGTPEQLLEEPADAYVAGFVGQDRGYRSLAFLPAAGLALEPVKVVRDAATADEQGPTLVVDGQAKPTGWADRQRHGQLIPLGSTFTPAADNLQTALDSALTSPYGLAVAVEPSGRYAGVVAASDILEQARDVRATATEPVEAAEPAESPDSPEPADSTEADQPAASAESAQPAEEHPDADAAAAPASDVRGEEKAEATIVVMRRRPEAPEVTEVAEDHDNVRVG